jgi:glycosyltransferase involved in cell wall biosynthesis
VSLIFGGRTEMAAAKKKALVTIGMPVYNCRATVAEAIASIINQTFDDWELVIFDDGSQDGTADIVRRFDDPRIRLLEDKANRGLPARLNDIVRRCKSSFFARMDGDDVAYPHRLEMQVEFLQKHTEVDLVAGAMIVFDRGGSAMGVRRSPREHRQICARPSSGFPMAHSAWLGRTDWFRRHAYRENAARMEDWDLLFRAYKQSRFANLREIVLGCREASLSLRKLANARWHKSRFIVEYARTQGNCLGALAEVGKQAAKLAMEAFALGSGLNHRLLRHRVPPATHTEVEEWCEVRDAVRKIAARYMEERESVPA